MKKMIFYCTLLFSSTIAISVLIFAYSLGTLNNDTTILFIILFMIEFVISLFFSIFELRRKD